MGKIEGSEGRSRLASDVIAGGVAGTHAVAAIKAGDILASVIENNAGVLTDRSAEFLANTVDGAISTDGEIDNTGGTDTSGDQLQVLYHARN